MNNPVTDDELADALEQAHTLPGVPPHAFAESFQSVAHLLDMRAADTPDAPCIIFYDEQETRKTYTYDGFNRRVNQVANYLHMELGVERGERVATIAYNHIETVLVYFACWKLGASVAPQNTGEDNARIAFILRNAACRVALVRPPYHERIVALQPEVPNLTRIIVIDQDYVASIDEQPMTFVPPAERMLEDESLLVYTSGTTGAPKGVQLTQYNMFADAYGICAWQHITAADRWMCVLPIHHVNGTIVTLVTPIFIGGSVVLNRAFKASSFWNRVADEQVHIVSVVPTILQFLSEANAETSRYDLRLRHIICGAGTLAVAVAQRFERTFGIPILHGYGLSETTCYSCFLPVDLPPADHTYWLTTYGYPSIGVPIDVNEMAIHDENGSPVADGERGEIVLRGHNVMRGYWERPDANREAFRGGWFHSGDEGFIVRDHNQRPFFFISGRLKELINRGGVKYSPFEIEETLLGISGVKVALAVAFPNTWYGEEVGAYVVLDDGANVSAEDILAYCRQHMAFAKSPKVVVFGTEVPVTTTGKYQRLRLQDRFTAWAETQFRG